MELGASAAHASTADGAGDGRGRHRASHPRDDPPLSRWTLSMQLPALFYGLYRDVKRRTARIVNRVPKGADWIALVEAEGFLDTATTPGFILLGGPSPLLGGEPHFQQWLLWVQFRAHWPDWGNALLEPIFQQSLTRPWSTLGLVAGQNRAAAAASALMQSTAHAKCWPSSLATSGTDAFKPALQASTPRHPAMAALSTAARRRCTRHRHRC